MFITCIQILCLFDVKANLESVVGAQKEGRRPRIYHMIETHTGPHQFRKCASITVCLERSALQAQG